MFGLLLHRNPEVPAARVEGRAPRGLRLLPGFITEAEHDEIAAWIASDVPWSGGSLQGNLREAYVDPVRPLPEWGRTLGARMIDAGIFRTAPNYLHLFSYQAGQGLARHVDQECWGETIVGLTLGSSRIFEFTRKGKASVPVRLLLMPGDLYVMDGEARHRWEHGVPFAKEDRLGGRLYPRSKGWSANFRSVDLAAPPIAQYVRSLASPSP